MQCGVYLRRLWTSRQVSTIAALEASYYLIQPWLQLVGTFVYPVPGIVFLANYAAGPAAMQNWVLDGGWMILIFYLAAGLGPFILWGPLYLRRCEAQLGIVRAVGLGFGYSLYVLIFYVTSWRAFWRILQHRSEWFKTARNAEYLADLELPEDELVTVGGLQMLTEMMGEH
jgi:hypothetical protein